LVGGIVVTNKKPRASEDPRVRTEVDAKSAVIKSPDGKILFDGWDYFKVRSKNRRAGK
jgi:hypothetical protein